MKYEIKGGNLPVVICNLEPGEKMITEGGGMSWMTPNMSMETRSGGFGKVMGKLFSGESMFNNIYTCKNTPGMIAFSSSFPGSIEAFEINPGNAIILQKSAFLAGEVGIDFSVVFNKKLGAGIFGGEGFIMQKISGNGIAFAEFDGHVECYTLAEGEEIVVDTSHLAAMDATCSMDIKRIQGAKNIFFGGEGLFNTTIKGPGRVWLQTMPIANIASLLAPYFLSGN